MTAAQKTAKANFKKAIEYRKKTGVSLKEAFAHVYGKKVGAVKKKVAKKKVAVKKVAKKKVAVKKVAKKKVAVRKKSATYQTGTSNLIYDKRHKAKKPGVRTTTNPHKYRGKTIRKSTTYTERRADRSDKGKLTGIGAVNSQALKHYEDVLKKIANVENHILHYSKMEKDKGYNIVNRKSFKQTKLQYKKYLSELKKQKSELKKLL